MAQGEVTEPTDVLDSAEAGGLVLRGGVLRFAGFAVSAVVALVGIAVISRHLGPSRFGQFQTVLSLITVVGAVTDLGMLTLGVREYSQLIGAERDQMLRVLLGLRLVLTVVGVVVAAALTAALGYGVHLVLGALLAGSAVVLIVLQTTLAIPLTAALRVGTISALDVLRQVLTSALYVAAAAVGAGTVWVLGAGVPAGLAVLIATAVLMRGTISMRPAFDVSLWLPLLRGSAVFAMATAVGTIYVYAAQIMSSVVAGDRQAGLFAASFRVFLVVGSVAGLLVTVAFPVLARAARDDQARLKYGLQRLLEVCAVLGCAAAVATVVGAPAIIAIAAGPKFSDAVPALRVEGVAVLASFLLSTWGFALLSLHLHRGLVYANVAALAMCVLGVIPLAYADGATGTAIASTLGELALAGGYLITLVRANPELTPQAGRPLRALAATGPAFAIMLLGLPSLLGAVVAVGVYGLGVLVLRALPDEIWEMARRRAA